MKKQIILLQVILCALLLCSCSHSAKINTKEDAVKFLESHTWKGKNVTYRLHGKETTNDAWNGDVKFSNNTVIYADERSNYTIARDEDGADNWFFILTFTNDKMSPFSHGMRTFKLYKDGTAHCYPSGDGDNDGVYADYDFPEERAPDLVTGTNPGNNSTANSTQQVAVVVDINDMNACLNYLKGRTFTTVLNKIVISSDLGVTVYRLQNNEQTFTGKIQLGNTSNSDRILEVHSFKDNSASRYFLNSDGTLAVSDWKFKPEPNHQDSIVSKPTVSASATQLKKENSDSISPAELSAMEAKIDTAAFTEEMGNCVVVAEKTYFYDRPDNASKKKAYMVKGETSSYFSTFDKFTYIKFTNPKGIKTKGWVLTSDLSIENPD